MPQTVHETNVTLSEQGVSLLLLDQQVRNNSDEFYRLRKRRMALLQQIAELDGQINECVRRDHELHDQAEAIRAAGSRRY